MTTPTIEERARTAASELHAHARTVARYRPSTTELRRRVRSVRMLATVATVVVALAAALTVNWATARVPPPLVGEGPTAPATPPATPPDGRTGEGDPYPPGEILARPAAGDRAPAGAKQPDTCGSPSGAAPVVTLVVGPGAQAPAEEAAVGCVILGGQQRLRIAATDGDHGRFTAELAGWRFRLDPGEAVVLDLPAEEYLQPGFHDLTSELAAARAQVMFHPRPTEHSGAARMTDPPFDTPWDDTSGEVWWSCSTDADGKQRRATEIEVRIDDLAPGTEVWWQLADGEGHANRYAISEQIDVVVTTVVGRPVDDGRWLPVDGTFRSHVEWDLPLDGRTLMLVTDPPYEMSPGATAVPTQIWEATAAGGVDCS